AIAIERELERLAYARVAAERIFLRKLALADIDRDALVADFGDLRQPEACVSFQLRHVGGCQALDEIELPRAKVRKSNGRVRNRQVDNPVEVNRRLVPVLGEPLEHDAVLRDALDESE